MASVVDTLTRPRRGRSRAKIDLSHGSGWHLADLIPLFGQLGLPTAVSIGQVFPGVLEGRPAYIEPQRVKYVEGRKVMTLPELYAVQHGYDRTQLTGPVERLWFDRLRFDAGHLGVPRLSRLHERWEAAKSTDLTESQRRVLDSILLLDELHRRANWRDDTLDETGMMLSERFLGPWASEPRRDRHISPATARRRRDQLLARGLLIEAPTQAGRRYFQLSVGPTERQ